MQTIHTHQAETSLPRQVEQAADSQPLATNKPLLKTEPLSAPQSGQQKRLGFMTGQIAVPDDFERMDQAGIEALFVESGPNPKK